MTRRHLFVLICLSVTEATNVENQRREGPLLGEYACVVTEQDDRGRIHLIRSGEKLRLGISGADSLYETSWGEKGRFSASDSLIVWRSGKYHQENLLGVWAERFVFQDRTEWQYVIIQEQIGDPQARRPGRFMPPVVAFMCRLTNPAEQLQSPTSSLSTTAGGSARGR
jgi:hypothetical protein